MAETTFVCPSELHLKKELSALRKARFLRDPETCSSWRSPVASRSVVACSSLIYGNANEGEGYSGANNSIGLLQVEPNPNLALKRSGNATKRVFLYNWGQHSCKSSDSGIKLDGDTKQGSAQASPEDSPVNPQKVNSKSNTFLDEPVPDFSIERARPETTTRRNARKSRRSTALKRRNLRDSVIPKLLDLPSRTFGVLSTQRSDDSEDCNSEDLRCSTQELIRRTGYASSSTSPFLSGSGCGNWSCSSRVLRNARKEESSYSVTPASTSSFNRYGHRHPSTIGSWDGTTASADGDERKQMELSRRQGYGIPHYSSKRVKHRGCGGWYSPSLSDTLKRKGSSILCGSQALCHKRRASGIRKQKFLSGTSQGLPLLTNGCDEDRSLVDTASDELSTNFGELDLEALSRLDGRRWSNCGSQEGLGMQLPSGDGEMPSHGSLSQKYRPRTFDEIVGQNIVVQSLHNAILRGRIAPAYLFHGPRGTGKTSTARIFAAALNCLTAGENKPCGFCQECTEFASGNGSNVREVDATNKKGIDRVRNMLKNMHEVASSSRHKVFIIDECHILSSKVWSAFIKFLEEPPLRIVFVFITIDLDNLPRAILSRCQKYVFPKIKEADIISRLRRLSAEEEFDVELDALDFIALNSDGSLRDAETMLDQLSLLGKRITTSLVNDLVGVVSDEKLLDLLEIAMSSDTAETVKRSRELMDSGVDPMALMSQLAGLIMDIIAGTYRLNSSKPCESVLRGRILTDAELDRLQQALRILSDAEKQLRLSSERSTWFTAALLQLGSGHSPEHNHSSGSNSKHSSQKTKTSNWVKGPSACKNSDALLKATQSCLVCTSSIVKMGSDANVNPSSTFPICEKNVDLLPICSQSADSTLMPVTCRETDDSERLLTKISPEKLNEVWKRCIEKCHSKTLRQLLSTHGQLISIFEAEGVLVVSIAFGNAHIKARAEGYVSSITNSMEVVLGRHVEVRIGSTPDNHKDRMPYFTDSTGEQTIISLLDKERKLTDGSNVLLGKESYEEHIYLHRKSTENCQGKPQRTLNVCENSQVPNASVQGAGSPLFALKENGKLCGAENTSEMSTRRIQTSAVDEQRLESAWLQTMDPGLVKPERNQILPQNGISYQHQTVSKLALAIPSKHWEDELNHEIKALKVSDTHSHHKEDFIGRIGALSPSLLHRATFAASFDKENPEYESGPGCNGLLCWKTRTRHRQKVKQRTHVSSQRVGHLLQFGPCTKSKTTESSFRR